MASIMYVLLLIAASIVAVAVAVFFIEVAAALLAREGAERASQPIVQHPRVAILVPAHNESIGLKSTLGDIRGQIHANDRLVVVADNCSDDTAAVAAATSAEVIERYDPTRRGKGYALDFGLQHLAADPPEVVIILDADCRLAGGTIEQLALACAVHDRPIQALYLMTTPTESLVGQRVAEFAWRVKNGLRPLGLLTLGLPCQLVGTGMAIPWNALRSVDLATGALVEDLKLGLDLASKGHAALFCPTARVTSEFPVTVNAAKTQRERWEHGHINLIHTTVPQLLGRGITRGDLGLLALALDLAVPPLSLLAMLVCGVFGISFVFGVLGFGSAQLIVSAATVVAFTLSVGLAWLKCGRDIVPFGTFFSILGYAFRKLGLYRSIFSGKGETRWVRTSRGNSERH